MNSLDELKYDKDGLVPAIVQESKTGEVLMLAYMNREALALTLRTGTTHFYSRSRKKLWRKGEVSGNTQTVDEVLADCDGDTLLIRVRQKGAACHEGYRTCFFRKYDGASGWKVLGTPVFDPKEVYKKK
ncbi:MAG: phosphoribosyl-AMP cyclohydrolase [Candidatus Abyssobacteria bacterium SURF_17]|uniref:Phosphoribosyl-AMP cyclohydrolase n=1 Tax=Candidatus Abyssobacteria bacterium SURF_17 TaxID=2093361 RepID=A0A419F2X6_9BACT|nr:MAG: phosphoribosyl-AMP cyclohydrolase [Candidatus Abyssubacteria bacterium SURF_17]